MPQQVLFTAARTLQPQFSPPDATYWFYGCTVAGRAWFAAVTYRTTGRFYRSVWTFTDTHDAALLFGAMPLAGQVKQRWVPFGYLRT